MALTETAYAKINLALHVRRRREDGYHELETLFAFVDGGDRLTARETALDEVRVCGEFAPELAGGIGNIVARALGVLPRAEGLAITLEKNLPVAAGLGGGSADAGTAIRLAAQLLDLDLDETALEAVAGVVGADGPMCLRARPAWATGRGDDLRDEPRLPPLHAVLLNPGLPSPTGAVYRAYDDAPAGGADRPDAPANWSPAAVIDWLQEQRNDLEAPALRVTPGIGEALAAMRAAPGCRLTRMSGSGATVFGLFDDAAAAKGAALALQRPGWWVRSCGLAGR